MAIDLKLLLLFFLVTGCQKVPEKNSPFTLQEFSGREERVGETVMVRRPVYRAKVPNGWIRYDPEKPITDTREPNVTFLIEDALKVTVHTFPTVNLEERIPPIAQVERWKQQINGITTSLATVSHGGFVGLCFEGPAVLAWSMQLDFEHYQTLSFLASSLLEEEHFKQMRADYTIKATGPQELIDRHKDELHFFANSFELIQGIPKRP